MSEGIHVKGRERAMQDEGARWTLECDAPENGKKVTACICFGKDDGLTDKGIAVSSWGAFTRHVFLLGKTSYVFTLQGLCKVFCSLSDKEQKTLGLKRHFSSLNFSAYLVSNIFGKEHSHSCLIISFIL